MAWWCPICREGEIHEVILHPIEKTIYLCDEADEIWESKDDIGDIRKYSGETLLSYLRKHGFRVEDEGVRIDYIEDPRAPESVKYKQPGTFTLLFTQTDLNGLENGLNETNINATDIMGNTILNYAQCICGVDIERIRILLNKGVDVDLQNMYGGTALLGAISMHRADIVKLMLERGADPNKPDLYGVAPLILALEKKYYVIAMILVSYGADIYYKHENTTPIDIIRSLEKQDDTLYNSN